MPVPCDPISNVDIDPGKGIGVNFSGGSYVVSILNAFANYSALTTAYSSPADGDWGYITGNSHPSGTGLVTPDATSVPAGPGLWVYDNRWTRPWNMPWGVMGVAGLKTADQGSISTSLVDVTPLTLTFTAAANRRLLLLASAQMICSSAGAQGNIAIVKTATAISFGTAPMSTTIGTTLTSIAFDSPAAGSITYKVQASVGAGTGTIKAGATFPSLFLIVDIGPNGSPA